MKLVEVDKTEKDSYNHFVMNNESGSFLQSWEWGEWQSAMGRQVKRYKFQVQNEDTIATVQLVKMPIFGKKHYWYAPYGPVVKENFQFSIFNFQSVLDKLRYQFPHAVFIRIEPKDKSITVDNALLLKSTNIQPGKSLVVDLTKSEEQLLSEMHHKTRYNIKVAQKHGVEINSEFSVSPGHGLFYEEAVKLIMETSKRQKFGAFPFAYYEKLVKFFKIDEPADVELHIYKAIFQNQLLACAVIIDFGRTRTFLFGGSSEFHKNIMAPYLLHWQAMLDAKANGLLSYDFWGIETASGNTPGFVRFKLGFGGQVEEYAGAHDLVIDKLWYTIYRFGRAFNKLFRY